MKRYSLLTTSTILATLFCCPANIYSQTRYKVAEVKSSMIVVDSTYDAKPDRKALAIVVPYKQKLKSLMTTQIGISSEKMERFDDDHPEGLLSNLIADVIRQSGTKTSGKTCDVGVMNKGGIRSILPKGPITISNVYEILPFENSLSVVTLKGSTLMELFNNIARTRGQGISGATLVITSDGKLVSAKVGGKDIDMNKLYRVATINYLAEGNNGLKAFADKSNTVQNFDNLKLHDIFLNYIKSQTAAGKQITSRLDGRLTFEKEK